MHKPLLGFTVLLLSGTIAVAQPMPTPMNADGLRWGAVPKVFPPGAQIAVVSGDPFKDGLYVVRLKMPAGYKIPAHNHPTTEYVTVISGAFNIGMGDKLDEQKGIALRPGGFAEAAAKMNHYAWHRPRSPCRSMARPLRHYLRQSCGRSEQEIDGVWLLRRRPSPKRSSLPRATCAANDA